MNATGQKTFTSLTRRVVVIQGFTQGPHAPNGCELLWRKLVEIYRADKHARVSLYQWSADFNAVAESIVRNADDDERNLRVVIIAYSWGAGRGFVELSRALGRHGVPITAAVLCDPVYFNKWLPWRAILSRTPLIDRVKITVPANVEQVWSFRQHTNRPQGHDLQRTPGADTSLHYPVELYGVTHQNCDDAWQFHDKAIEVTAELIGTPD